MLIFPLSKVVYGGSDVGFCRSLDYCPSVFNYLFVNVAKGYSCKGAMYERLFAPAYWFYCVKCCMHRVFQIIQGFYLSSLLVCSGVLMRLCDTASNFRCVQNCVRMCCFFLENLLWPKVLWIFFLNSFRQLRNQTVVLILLCSYFNLHILSLFGSSKNN